MKRWYAVYTKPGSEAAAARLLETAGVQTLNPRIRRRRFVRRRYEEVIEELFPCYFFARFDPSTDSRLVRFTRGVRHIVGKDHPLPVYDGIIEGILQRLDGDIVKPAEERFSPGDAVVIDEGPFKDFFGVFERDLPGRERVMILLAALHTRLELEPRSLRRP